MAWIPDVVNPFRSRSHCRGPRARQRRLRAPFERLESRLALANTAPSNFPIQLTQSGTELYILYSQPTATGFVQTSDQHVVVDIDEFFTGVGTATQRVNVYASTNPQANLPGIAGNVFIGITAIHVTVPNYDAPGVNNNSLTIKGINGPTDRIIVSGSGRTAAGRWSDESAPQLQIVFDIAGIDDLTVTAGGVINVSGAFTNDTGDASIHAVGEIAERQADQMTATVIVGETTPTPGALPQSRLVSNYIEIIGAEIDIYSDIEATGQVILRQPATTPQTARANLILPYDVTVTDDDGVLELHSTRNIVQLQSSTLVAHKAVAISNIGDINVVDGENSIGPWLIDLGSVNNDFDTISLGMVSNAIDTPNQEQSVDARGRIGVRDIDDLTVADFGILATTGIVTLRSVGPLTIDAAVQATGLLLQSDTGVTTTPRAVVSVNSPTPDTASPEPVAFVDLGVTIDVSTASGDASAGDVTLDGRIVMDLNNVREDEDTTNKTGYGGVTIHAAGQTNLNSQILTLGDIRVHSQRGIAVRGQLQAGGTFISKNGTVVELVAADLSLTTATGDITVTFPTANLPLPTTLSATNLLAMDAGGDISLAGSLFAGSLYNNTADLPVDNDTLPSITIRAVGDFEMAQTAVLKTRAYGTNYNASPNPQIGLITVSDANSLTSAATIDADGALRITTRGDVTLSGETTTREAIFVRTQAGDIDVQGGLVSRGAIYTTDSAATPPFVVPVSWTPNITLDAPNGAISTSDTGILKTGSVTLDGVVTNGAVSLNTMQDIRIGANIDAAGVVVATSKLGTFDLSAVLQARNGSTVTITAGNGIVQSDLDLASVVTTQLDLLNTGAAGGASDIDLRARNNQIGSINARNLSPGGAIRLGGVGAIAIGTSGLSAHRDGTSPSVIELSSAAGITQTGPLVADQLFVNCPTTAPITLGNTSNNVDQFAAASLGAVRYSDADDFETGVQRPASPATVPVEVFADSLTLTSAGTKSTIRIVSGLRYRTLSIQAGVAGGSAVGTVEYVTTSSVDNPAVGAGFGGTLRDMIRYANDNSATYTVSGTVRPQPQAMVFDEDGYDVETISVGAVALPGFTKPVTFDGGRLTDDVLTLDPSARLGIVGSITAATGLRFDPGSNGSVVRRLAVGGFPRGSGILLASSGSTVTDVWAGLDRDGNTPAPNLVGIEVSGTAATGNLIGSVVVDEATRNQITSNVSAGVLIRGGSSGTRVFGNLITANGDPTTGVGDGVRINNATNTLVGSPDAMQPDMLASTSNVIGANGGNGVRIMSSNPGSFVTANRVRNNLVVANGRSGIAVDGSQFALIGGTVGNAGNTVIAQLGAGVSITNSANIRLLGNDVGLDDSAGNATPDGNGGNGVTVSGSRLVEISSGNRIVDNTLNGILIDKASTSVTVTNNTIGQEFGGNGADGIRIDSSIGNTVGTGNVVSFNGGSGASIVNARATSLATGNRIFGSTFASNVASGVSVSGGGFSAIGGMKAGDANLIQSNGESGITLQWNAATGSPTGFAIEGNRIGTDANRAVAPLGNAASGIRLVGATNTVISTGNAVMNNVGGGIVVEGGANNVVGGGVAGRGNQIMANTSHGVTVRPATLAGLPATLRAARNVTVMGNTIADNVGDGVRVTGATSGPSVTAVTIGTPVTTSGASGLGNVIRGNTGFGVNVATGAQQIAFQGNSIVDNDAGGVRVAPGANRSTAQTITLTSAVLRGTGSSQSVTIAGRVSNPAARQQQYTIDFYANSPADGDYPGLTGYQARRFIGRATVVSDAAGNATFSLRITAAIGVGDVITATATSLRFEAGSTSQLSNAVTADLVGIATPRF